MRINDINEVAEERYGKKANPMASVLVDIALQDLKNAFVEGALWSDDHPSTELFHPSNETSDLDL